MGSRLVIKQRVWVGDGFEVSSITDQIWAEESRVKGKVISGNAGESHVALHVFNIDGSPVTQSYSVNQGEFEFNLPPGKYHIEARPEGRPSVSRVVNVFPGVSRY